MSNQKTTPETPDCLQSALNDLLWHDISSAPKDGTKIVAWFVPNEVNAPHKAKPWITWWEMKQWKDATGKKIGEPFGIWVVEEWNDPMSYAPTHWINKP